MPKIVAWQTNHFLSSHSVESLSNNQTVPCTVLSSLNLCQAVKSKKKKKRVKGKVDLFALQKYMKLPFFLFHKIQSLYWLEIGYSRKILFVLESEEIENPFSNFGHVTVFVLDEPCWNTVRLNGCHSLKGPLRTLKKRIL